MQWLINVCMYFILHNTVATACLWGAVRVKIEYNFIMNLFVDLSKIMLI